MTRLEIPGHYYDEQKGKYFKIVKSHLASSSSAAYTSDNVKRRKLEDEAHRQAEKRKQFLRKHIRRHPFLSKSDLTSGLLDREVGAASAAYGLKARCTLTYGEGEIRGRAWARGLEEKGEVSFAASFARGRMANMGCFWVDGTDERTGMGVGYGGLDEETLVGSYIPTDENERICFSRASTYMRRPLQMPTYRTEIVRCPQMSSIKYHAPSHKMLITSRELDHSAGLYIFSPPLSEEGSGQPMWLLGEANMYQRLSTLHRLRDQWVVHSSTPAPPSLPSTICLLSTNAGILRVSSSEAVTWLSSPPPAAAASASSPEGRKRHQQQPQLPREIFSSDFSPANPDVVYAGGRQSRLWRADLRTSGREWGFASVGSSLAHVKCLSDSEILVAGPRHLMAVYDARMFTSRRTTPLTPASGSWRSGGKEPASVAHKDLAKPVVTFPEYRNEAHIHTGLDVSRDLGLVAASMDDGTVKLFSLISGRMLRTGGSCGGSKNRSTAGCESVGKLSSQAGGGFDGLDSIKTDTPVKAVQFQKMPWERWESLWVAEGPALRKFSFGAREWDDEV